MPEGQIQSPRPPPPKRLGLYGGSFDPVHLGHLLVATAAMEELRLDRLVFIPAGRSPFKPGLEPAPPERRAALLRQALAGRPRMEVDTLEIDRGGVSYSIDTVREFRRRHPQAELFWLIGADHVAKLDEWREAAALAEAVTFLVIPRPGEPAVERDGPWRLVQLRGWPLKVSSSEIRDRVRNGLPVDHLVPPGISEAIQSHGLYSAAHGQSG
jgi:nicotinate-nucleotide adenylyltransferase